MGKTKGAYSIPLEKLAQMVAAHTSGIKKAEPNFDDYEFANEIIRQIDMRYEDE